MAETRRVLLIEDHDDARDLLELLCELAGHEVVAAAGGAAGIESALAFEPHVAFVDIRMPDMDGYDVARELRRRMGDKCPRLVALSGFGTAEVRERALRAGFDEYVTKPIDAKWLQAMIAAS